MFSPRGEEVALVLAEEEADVLRNLLAEYLRLLDRNEGPDPVRDRLFPDASLDDSEVAEDYRSMTSGTLEDDKRRAAQTATNTLGDEGQIDRSMGGEDADAWVRLLTDLRLAIGVRLDVTEDDMGREVDPKDPSQYPMTVLHWLGALQESLVRALSSEGP
jgi:hypothetical protein